MLKTICFDLDDTLLWDKKSIQTAFDRTCESVANIDASALEEAVRSAARKLYQSYPTYEHTQMIGINPFEGLWGTFDDPGEAFQQMKTTIPNYQFNAWKQGLLALNIDDDALAKTLSERFIVERMKHPFTYEETFDVLDELRDDYTLLLLTNGAPSLQRLKLDITKEIAQRFNHVVISGEFGRGKPDPAIFEYALSLADTDKSDAIMIGDNLNTDILGSNRIGMKNIWINHHNQTVKDIQPTYEVKRLKEVLPIIKRL
ncbi:putative uncharacterized hydrolase YsaA [Halolactibacillus alkaliphilus]|uniref:Phosphoserine phosphatase n=1 Tax=Halolactibacillus alkaliphilus TaxID=442899 RepID=A0A511X0I5_9BACI|nr:HAD family hydrolase [Halolactibacillus alkaliphilus]GEN56430.1 putative uncharacterized hydrolase YsaA [Halolactibacillus alkaliphilus]GGN64479.1 putative uncharacterized hydrolase YsaA [Halolactibacillus alkaliphilus]SFO61026.1 putative hydrolase of the HAD superfamily [Halolactibacillus alkaliphilus]